MFSTLHPLAAQGWHNQRHAHALPCASTAGRVVGGSFLHSAITHPDTQSRIPHGIDGALNSVSRADLEAK